VEFDCNSLWRSYLQSDFIDQLMCCFHSAVPFLALPRTRAATPILGGISPLAPSPNRHLCPLVAQARFRIRRLLPAHSGGPAKPVGRHAAIRMQVRGRAAMAREPCQSLAAGTQPCAASLIACMERKKSAHPVDPKASCVTRRRTWPFYVLLENELTL
jgi:hypothetical protein